MNWLKWWKIATINGLWLLINFYVLPFFLMKPHSIFDRSTYSKRSKESLFSAKNFVVNLLNFSVFHHVFISSLDMFKKCINSYHIESKQVQTCLRILWIVTINIILNLNKFRHVWTCSDMFKNRINSYHIESEQVWTWFESHINRNNSYHIESKQV